MQRHRRLLRLRSTVPQLLCQNGLRRLQVTSGALSSSKEATEATTTSADSTNLHSVVSIAEGPNAFAAATVTFTQAEEAVGYGNQKGASTAQHAAQVALLAIRGALGCQRPPSALVASVSLDLPRSAVQAVAESLSAALKESGTPVIGCSSRLRVPDEIRANGLRGGGSTAGRGNGVGAAASSSTSTSMDGARGSGESSEASTSQQSQQQQQQPRHLHHITLAAAHLPDYEVYGIRSETASLPRLPYLAESLQGRRPPAFLLLTGADSQAAELLARLQNLFPGSCVGAGVAAQQSARDRSRLMLVGPGGGSSSNGSSGGSGGSMNSGIIGSNSSGGSSASSSSSLQGGPRLAREEREQGPFSSLAEDAFLGGEAGGAAGEMYGSGRSRRRGRPASDFEGPFQRMLLGREGAPGAAGDAGSGAAAATTTTSTTTASNGNSNAGSSSSSSINGISSSAGTRVPSAFHRRRPQPAASTSAPSSSSSSSTQPTSSIAPAETTTGSGSFSSSSAAASSSSQGRAGSTQATTAPPPPAASAAAANAAAVQEEAAAEAFAASLRAFQPSFVMVGGEVHGGGCALLAIYPKTTTPATPASPSSTTTPAATPAPGTSGSGAPPAAAPALAAPAALSRLSGAACDLLARVALGTDQLHHVTLRGAALSAISPPPTGPEPSSATSPSPPDNPYYWLPASATPPALRIDPHLHAPLLQQQEEQEEQGQHKHDQQEGQQEGQHPQPLATSPAAAGNAGVTVSGSGEVDAGTEGAAGWETEGGEETAVEEAEEAVPSAAALAALSEGLSGLPLFPLEGAVLFPGQTMQLRVFEKRYRLLLRACLEQGTAFGLCWRGTGCTAVVRSWQCAGNPAAAGNSSSSSGTSSAGGVAEGGGREGGEGVGDVMVMLEGGVRFSYGTEELGVLPATYGLNVAKRAEYVLDEPPANDDDLAAMCSAAYAIIDGIAGALEAGSAPPARQTARNFANALHFASSIQPTTTSATPAAGNANADTTTTTPPSTNPSSSGITSTTTSSFETTSSSSSSKSDSESDDAALLAADVAEAKRCLDADTASLLSLYLAPHIPVQLESLRREWFTTRNALWRLQQEASWLRNNPRVCMAVASSVLRLARDHPLRLMLGLSRVAASS